MNLTELNGKRLKVLHLLKTSTGASWALREMRELVALGVEVHVALPQGGPLYDKYSEYGIYVHPMQFSLKQIRQSGADLRRILEEVSPDIIQSHFVLTTLIMRLTLRNNHIPRIFEVPGPLHLEHRLTRLVDISTAQKNDYWIPTCKWSLNRYRKSGISEDRLFLTYYGGEIAHKKYEKGKLRKEFDIPDSMFVAAMVAYMYAPKKWLGQKRGLKGHEDFIDAIGILQKKYDDIVGVCIGGAWDGAVEYEQSVKDYAKSKGVRIIFTGTRNNVGDLYQDVDCAVHPSHSENLGGAAESLSLGIPTVASTVGGFPDIVIDGKTGLLAPPMDPQKLADAIERFYLDRDFALKCADAGQKLVDEMLDVKNTTRDVFNFYHEILSR